MRMGTSFENHVSDYVNFDYTDCIYGTEEDEENESLRLEQEYYEDLYDVEVLGKYTPSLKKLCDKRGIKER